MNGILGRRLALMESSSGLRKRLFKLYQLGIVFQSVWLPTHLSLERLLGGWGMGGSLR